MIQVVSEHSNCEYSTQVKNKIIGRYNEFKSLYQGKTQEQMFEILANEGKKYKLIDRLDENID